MEPSCASGADADLTSALPFGNELIAMPIANPGDKAYLGLIHHFPAACSATCASMAAFGGMARLAVINRRVIKAADYETAVARSFALSPTRRPLNQLFVSRIALTASISPRSCHFSGIFTAPWRGSISPCMHVIK